MPMKLTEDHKRKLREDAAEWRDVILCTDPADRPKAEDVLARMYKDAKLDTPPFVWVGSPYAAAHYIAEASSGRSTALQTRSGQPLSFLQFLDESCGGNLWEEMYSAVPPQDLSMPASLRSVVRRRGGYTFPDRIVYAQHDNLWVPFYKFPQRHLGAEYPPRVADWIDLWDALCRSTGWVFPYKEVCVCCDRPSAQSVNDRGVPRSVHAPAVEFRDGTKVWVLDGHNVDERLVMSPETQSLPSVRNELNAELKRIRIERFAGRDKSPAEGWKRYLRESNARCIDRRRNDIEHTEEALFRTKDGETILVCACPSTARLYALEVPQSCHTVEQAQAFLHSQSKIDATTPNVIGRS